MRAKILGGNEWVVLSTQSQAPNRSRCNVHVPRRYCCANFRQGSKCAFSAGKSVYSDVSRFHDILVCCCIHRFLPFPLLPLRSPPFYPLSQRIYTTSLADQPQPARPCKHGKETHMDTFSAAKRLKDQPQEAVGLRNVLPCCKWRDVTWLHQRMNSKKNSSLLNTW